MRWDLNLNSECRLSLPSTISILCLREYSQRIAEAAGPFHLQLIHLVDGCNGVRHDPGSLFHRRSEHFQGFVEMPCKKRVLRLFVPGQIGEMRLSGTSGIVLKAKELFERVPIEEKWRLPDDS